MSFPAPFPPDRAPAASAVAAPDASVRPGAGVVVRFFNGREVICVRREDVRAVRVSPGTTPESPEVVCILVGPGLGDWVVVDHGWRAVARVVFGDDVEIVDVPAEVSCS